MSASSRPMPADAPVTTASGRAVAAMAAIVRSRRPATGSATYADRVTDPRRQVPRTDVVLADARLAAAAQRLGPDAVKSAVVDAQDAARRGDIAPDAVAD